MKQRCFKCFQIFWLEVFFDGFQLLSKLFGLKQVSSRFLVFDFFCLTQLFFLLFLLGQVEASFST